MLTSSLLILLAVEPVASGIDLYETGRFEQSRAELARALDTQLPTTDKNRARLYLAADYFALGDRRGALYALEDLARQNPKTFVDTSVFPPDFIRLWDDARAHVTGEKRAVSILPSNPTSPRVSSAVVFQLPRRVEAPGPRRSLKALGVIPAGAAIAFGAWGLYSYLHAQSLYAALTGGMRPALLADGQSLVAQGKAANVDAAIGAAAFFAGSALAVALMFLL
jgi:hypothetical protein